MIGSLEIDMHSGSCGFPYCCPGNQPHFVRGQDFPDIIVEKNLGEKLHEFMERINTKMYETGQPPCPINILTFLMIPFCCLSPVCWMTERNHNKRLDGVNKAKQEFNEDYGKD